MLGSTSEHRDEVDPAEALVREVGAQLREARLQRGEDLEDVAQALRIKPAYLFAIEQGDLSGLPGRTYALGFLRSYAEHLGFDGDDLVGRIKSSVGRLTDRTGLRIRAPMPETRLPRTPMVVISLAVVAGLYFGWSYVNRASRTVMDTVAEVPGDLRELARIEPATDVGHGAPASSGEPSTGAALPDRGSSETGPAAPVEITRAGAPSSANEAQASSAAPPDPAARGATIDAAPGQPAPAAADELAGPAAEPEEIAGPIGPSDRLAQGASEALAVQPAAGDGPAAPAPMPDARAAAQDATPPAIAAQTEVAALAPAAPADDAQDASPARLAVMRVLEGAAAGAGEVYERANTDARVILRARDRTWIEVSSPSGDYRFTRILEPGEAVLVPDRPDLELWTGNAGGLEIIVDGVPVSPLAGAGAVRRNVPLDPGRLSEAAARSR